MIALICEMCGAPMENRRKCGYCRVLYYTGPEVPAPSEGMSMRHISGSSCMVMNTYSSYVEPYVYGPSYNGALPMAVQR